MHSTVLTALLLGGNDLDDNNMDNELAKTSASPQKKLYFHDGTSPCKDEGRSKYDE